MGPVLVKQDQREARANVETRLDYIRGEMYVFTQIVLLVWIVTILHCPASEWKLSC